MSDCPRFGKLFRGCKFEARHDKGPVEMDRGMELKGDGGGLVLERFRRITYVRDVCIRCGKTVERKP